MYTLILTIAMITALVMPPDSLPSTEVPQSLGVQIKSYNCSAEDLEQVSKLGVGFIRRGFYWQSVEKEKGVYDFSSYDSLLRETDTRGLRVLACLYGGNTLYEDDGQGGIQTEAGRRGFAGFSAAMAEHFSGRGIIWEIWNEPNIGSFWRRGSHNTDEFAREYTSLVQEIVPAMHAADPGCFVVAGAVSALWQPSFNWMDECMELGILKSGINGWSIHPYSFRTPEEQADGYAKVRELLSRYGAPGDFPLLNSERGFTLDSTRREGWTGGFAERASEYMAWHAVRQYLIDLMSGMGLSIYYEWGGEDFGLTWEEEKRTAYTACHTMLEQLNGYGLKERVKTSSSLDYLLVFENTEGKQKMVAWTAPPPGATPEETVLHTIEVKVKTRGKLIAWNLYGEPFTLSSEKGTITLSLSGAPQFISLSGK